ncbi:hypothetical protein IMZ48_04285 [Candidatus Bathyarchaeota archaeon]|nr:hypothetical protein [Candidatus Bathyarchaeota archaeon]
MDDTHAALYERLLEWIRGGLLGPREGKGVAADVAAEDEETVTFVVALVSIPPSGDAIERHLVQLGKSGGML